MLVIFCGKSGSGKDLITSMLVDDGAKRLVSTTSRPMRDGEKEGVNYYYTSKDKFLKKIDNDDFVEYRKYNTLINNIPDECYYGTDKNKLKDINSNELTIAIKDISGANLLKEYCMDNNIPCISILLETSPELREDRASKRGGFCKSEWDRRLIADEKDFQDAKYVCDAIFENNGTVDDLYNKVSKYINKIIDYDIER